MVFKPNYNHQRAERDRAKQAKKEAKLRNVRTPRPCAARPSRMAQSRRPANPTIRRVLEHRPATMKRRADSTFVLFDVTYSDGTQTSNRKVLASMLGGLDGDEPAKAAIEAQDREIGLASGRPRGVIKSVSRKRI